MPQPSNALSPEHEGRLQVALTAYSSGHFRSHQAAAKVFNVKRRTLSHRAQGLLFRAEAAPNSRKLTVTEEQTIVRYILDLGSREFAPRLCKVADMADKLLGVCGGQPRRAQLRREWLPDGCHWLNEGCHRRRETYSTCARSARRSRVGNSYPERLRCWILYR
jgi:hypothetical protein